MQPHQRCFGKERHYSAGEERQQRQPRCSKALLAASGLRECAVAANLVSKLVSRFRDSYATGIYGELSSDACANRKMKGVESISPYLFQSVQAWEAPSNSLSTPSARSCWSYPYG